MRLRERHAGLFDVTTLVPNSAMDKYYFYFVFRDEMVWRSHIYFDGTASLDGKLTDVMVRRDTPYVLSCLQESRWNSWATQILVGFNLRLWFPQYNFKRYHYVVDNHLLVKRTRRESR